MPGMLTAQSALLAVASKLGSVTAVSKYEGFASDREATLKLTQSIVAKKHT